MIQGSIGMTNASSLVCLIPVTTRLPHGNTCFVIVCDDVRELLLALRLSCSSIVDPFEIDALRWLRQFCVFGCSADLVTAMIIPHQNKKKKTLKGSNNHSTLSVPSAD